MTTPSRAPEIRMNYPGALPRLSRAWDHCWTLLGDGQWLAAPELARLGAAVVEPPLTETSVRNALRVAVQVGLLEREARSVIGEHGQRMVAFYRRVDVA